MRLTETTDKISNIWNLTRLPISNFHLPTCHKIAPLEILHISVSGKDSFHFPGAKISKWSDTLFSLPLQLSSWSPLPWSLATASLLVSLHQTLSPFSLLNEAPIIIALKSKILSLLCSKPSNGFLSFNRRWSPAKGLYGWFLATFPTARPIFSPLLTEL